MQAVNGLFLPPGPNLAVMTDQPTWDRVDHYLDGKLHGADEALDAATAASTVAGLPAIAVSPMQGRFLELIARSIGAQKSAGDRHSRRVQHHLSRSGVGLRRPGGLA